MRKAILMQRDILLENLSQLITEKNKLENKISTITGRPALIGHTGVFQVMQIIA